MRQRGTALSLLFSAAGYCRLDAPDPAGRAAQGAVVLSLCTSAAVAVYATAFTVLEAYYLQAAAARKKKLEFRILRKIQKRKNLEKPRKN